MTSPWTPAEIPDQQGRTALVTGANSGLGFHTSLELARRGARVLLACRDPGRGEQALDRLRAEVPAASVELVGLDLASLRSVRAAARDVADRVDRLDLLIDNAGVMAVPRRLTEDGFELQLGTTTSATSRSPASCCHSCSPPRPRGSSSCPAVRTAPGGCASRT